MTNQRTEAPILAALTAATSPTPPGGEITTTDADASSAVRGSAVRDTKEARGWDVKDDVTVNPYTQANTRNFILPECDQQQ
jgi:hypothetical protein